jgi:hypothetical protein
MAEPRTEMRPMAPPPTNNTPPPAGPPQRGLRMEDVQRMIGELYLEVSFLRAELQRRDALEAPKDAAPPSA